MNKIMLIGNVGRDPEVRYVERDVPVARVTLATSERGYTLPNGTQVPGRTDWHTIIFWNRLAKVVEKYVRKGDRLYVEGRIRYMRYDDKNGRRVDTTEIWAEDMEMLGGRSRQEAPAEQPKAAPEQPQAEGDGLPF